MVLSDPCEPQKVETHRLRTAALGKSTVSVRCEVRLSFLNREHTEEPGTGEMAAPLLA